jgi:hypothetical protein
MFHPELITFLLQTTSSTLVFPTPGNEPPATHWPKPETKPLALFPITPHPVSYLGGLKDEVT